MGLPSGTPMKLFYINSTLYDFDKFNYLRSLWRSRLTTSFLD